VPDIYLYEDTPVLRNKLDIRDEKILDMIEAEQSRQNMMLLYEQGFSDFSPEGLCRIHKTLLGDI
jgi:cell filamentation protein